MRMEPKLSITNENMLPLGRLTAYGSYFSRFSLNAILALQQLSAMKKKIEKRI